MLLVDLFVEERQRWITSTLSGLVLLGAFLPIVTLGVIGDDVRSMFDGRYVVDEFALVLKALFLLTGYVVVLMSSNEIEEGGYHQGEYYVLLLSSILGMVMMASRARPRSASSSRSSSCRSRRTCSPRGASATRAATRRA